MYFTRIFILLITLYFSDAYSQKTALKAPQKPITGVSLNASEGDFIISDFIRIDPNPFIDIIQIELLEEGTEMVEIHILSIVGKVVRKFSFPSQVRYELNLSDLEKGIYLLKINNGKYSCVKRILHQ